MATQKVNIDISTKGAKKSKEELNGLNGAIGKMGKAVGIASAAYFGAKGLISAFSTVIESSARQEQAEKALEVALGRTSTALLNQASALQSVTTAGDEALIEQQAFLASLKFTEDQIKTIIPVALDLSAATGISLESAVRNTSKTFSGLAGELGELVPQLRDLTQEEMKAGEAVKVLGELFKGQATEQAKTMAGALQQAQNSAGDLAEAIGVKLSPFVKILAEDFTNATQSLTAYLGPEAISREEQLANLMERRSQLLGEEVEKRKEATTVSSLFTLQALEANAVEKENIDIGIKAIDEQIAKYHDLLFARKEELELKRSSADETKKIEKVEQSSFDFQIKNSSLKNKMIQADLKNAALQQSSAKDAMKAVVRAETMEAIAGYISSIMKSVPFPINLIVSAGAGAVVSGIIDKGLSGFADGGIVPGSGNTDSVPAMLTPGEVILNAAQQDNLTSNMGGVTLNIQGNVIGTEEFVRDTLIPEINNTIQNNLS